MVGYETDGEDESVAVVYFNDLYSNATIQAETQSFVKSRKACSEDARSSQDGGLAPFCLPKKYDYGIAISGNEDIDGVLLPVRLDMDQWKEPDYSKEDGFHEAPTMMGATVTVSDLTLGTRYALLRFEDPAAVPKREFLKARFAHKTEFVAKVATWTTRVAFMSNSTILFRCVEVQWVMLRREGNRAGKKTLGQVVRLKLNEVTKNRGHEDDRSYVFFTYNVKPLHQDAALNQNEAWLSPATAPDDAAVGANTAAADATVATTQP
eukprot:SAG31_NODE_83_length_27039_cov_14.035746_2_plen_265_part_00